MQYMKQRLLYTSALAGSGKTYALVRYAHSLARKGRKVLFVQPTKELIDKTVTDELGVLPPIRHRRIHGTTEPGRVVAEIVRHFKETDDGGEIVFITQSAFLRTPYLENKNRWIAIFDEVIQVDQPAEFNIPDTKDLILPHLETSPYDTRYARLEPANASSRNALAKIARNKDSDQVWGLFEGFADRISSLHWETFVLENQFENLRTGKGDKRRLSTFSILGSTVVEGFAQVIFAGACFEDSMLYRLWSAQGAEFQRLKLKLRYNVHENGKLIRILYLTDDAWSKTLRDKQSDEGEGQSVLHIARDRVLAEMGSQEFLLLANRDIDDGLFAGANVVRLPNTPHGLNNYQGVHNTVILSALNPFPSHFAFLDARGIDGEEVRTAHYRHAAYQAIMRSSIRNPEDQNPKTIVVMDRDTASWLSDLFPGASVSPLGGRAMGSLTGKPGRPRIHATPAARKAAFRRNREIELLIEQDIISGGDLTIGDYPDLAGAITARMQEVSGLADPLALSKGAFAESWGSVFGSIYDKAPMDHFDYGDEESFIRGLRSLHDRTIPAKTDAGLISPAWFDADMNTETSRGLKNIRNLRGIWLDNDGGDLSHSEFARLFPRLRIVIWNTYSATPEKPRWRAFIPTTQAMSKAVHGMILGQIMYVLNREGFWSQAERDKKPSGRKLLIHGFDMSKLNGSSLFYLPSQALHPKGSFFIDHCGGIRRPIEPYDWIKRSVKHDNPVPAPVISKPIQPPLPVSPSGGSKALQAIREKLAASTTLSGKERAIQQWRDVAGQKGQGRKAFWVLANSLRRAGLDDWEISQTLSEEAIYAHNPPERRAEIAGNVKASRKAVR